jgi:Arc/MetJ-type ribon-helix-helix transcriptional regulator
MPRPSTAPVRKQVSLPSQLAQAVDEYRFENRFPSESEAIRRLIVLGLQATKPDAEGAHAE